MRKFLRRGDGFTLIETLVALMLFALFGLAAVASLTLAMRQWGQLSKKVNASQNARFVAGVISAELRQGTPNPSAFGFTGAGLAPTAVLMPNTNQVTSYELIFNEPVPSVFNPLDPTWDETRADNYRRVRYFVRNGSEVVREEITYSGGSARPATEEVIARGDFLDLAFSHPVTDEVQTDQVIVTVTARQGAAPDYFHEVGYTSMAYILGK